MADENPSVASGIVGMFNVFVDPGGLAKAAKAKLFWLWPLIIVSIIFVVFGYLMMPYTLQLAEVRLAQQNVPPERLENARNMAHTITQVFVYLVPVFIVLVHHAGRLAGGRDRFHCGRSGEIPGYLLCS